MRMMPSRYATGARPAQVKKQVSNVRHISAPLKGLSLSSQLSEGDPLTAPILDNWIIEENRITCRPGYQLLMQLESQEPLWALIPFYGEPQAIACATANALYDTAGNQIASGYTSGNWHWTSFSNLSDQDYTVMVNGADGVWSWDGGTAVEGAPVAAVQISNANPAVVTVDPADIGTFADDMRVTISGATGDMAVANGTWVIDQVNGTTNTFVLVGCDTSAAAAPQVGGITVTPAGSFVKEPVTAPAGKGYINPDSFTIVMSHMNRLWFADPANLAIYYLPLQQKSGEVKEFPLNALFRRGGSIRAIYTWTLDGGAGLDDQLVIFSTNGEAVIYSGADPDSDFNLVGIYRFDSPMSKHCVVQYGGELYALCSTGLLPMSRLMRSEDEQLGKYDKNVYSAFEAVSRTQRLTYGWQVLLDHTTGRTICNMPLGGVNQYKQMVRFMPNPVWASWSTLPTRCWGWIDNRLFLGCDRGCLYEMSPTYLNDNGKPIRVDVQGAWSSFKTPAVKQFKMIKPYLISDGAPKPYVDIRVDYSTATPINQPDVTLGAVGAAWDEAEWDVDYWAAGEQVRASWNGVSGLGNVGAPRMVALISNCTFSLTGWDVLYETGSVMG